LSSKILLFGKIFGKGSIDNILRNPVYCGKIEHKGKFYEGIHKAIIPEAVFLKIQGLRKVRIKPETKIDHPYLLGGLLRCQDCGSVMSPSYVVKRKGEDRKYIYYYRCTKTCKHDWNSCSIKMVNADRIEKFITDKLLKISKDEKAINTLVRQVNDEEAKRLTPLRKKEEKLLKELREIEKKIKNLISCLSEGEERIYPSIKKELGALENRKKVLEFDLEGVRLAIQKEGQTKFEAKIVLDNLKEFSHRLTEVPLRERPHLFQYLIKQIIYGKDVGGK